MNKLKIKQKQNRWQGKQTGCCQRKGGGDRQSRVRN